MPYKFDSLSSCHNSSYASRFGSKYNYIYDLIKIKEDLKNALYSIKLDSPILTQKIVELKLRYDRKN